MGKMYILLIMIPLFLVSCDGKLRREKLAGCYFQYEYVNSAWGFSHRGFTITPSGEVYSFDKSTPWVFADKDKLSIVALRKNLEASIKADTLINRADIDRYKQLALSAMSGKLSDRVMRGADIGGKICKIIVPDSADSQNGFCEVILTENGDFEQHNLSPEAAVIAEWLKQIRLK